MTVISSGILPQSSVVGVVGSGTMGAGIAQLAAAAGHPVTLYDSQTGVALKAIRSIQNNFQKLVSKGKLSPNEAQRASERLHAASSLGDLFDSSLVVEAVVEDLELKQGLFSELEAVVNPNCILATNTSSLSITAIASFLKTPQRMVGMHFFNPAPLMELVEVISGLETSVTHLATVYATAKAWGKSPVYVKSTPGFIVNRVARPYYGEALQMLAEQAGSPATIDAVMREAAGFRMGPFELMDLIGIDVNFAVSQSVFNACFGDPRYKPSWHQQEMIRAGHLGRKAKRGFYEYADGSSQAQPSVEPTVSLPKRVTVPIGGAFVEALKNRLGGSGIMVTCVPSKTESENWIEVGDSVVAVTDGRTAMQRAYETGHRNVVLVDLALDYGKALRLAVARAASCSESAYFSAVGLLQGAGYAVSGLKDIPGMATMRTVAMLANEASDIVHTGIATTEDVDTAMRKGVNYPKGPLAWADEIGIKTIHSVLHNLAAYYGGDRYRISPRIKNLLWHNGQPE